MVAYFTLMSAVIVSKQGLAPDSSWGLWAHCWGVSSWASPRGTGCSAHRPLRGRGELSSCRNIVTLEFFTVVFNDHSF